LKAIEVIFIEVILQTLGFCKDFFKIIGIFRRLLVEGLHLLFFVEKVLIDAIEIGFNRHVLLDFELLIQIGKSDPIRPKDLALVGLDLARRSCSKEWSCPSH
jgi:hypothetical protein